MTDGYGPHYSSFGIRGLNMFKCGSIIVLFPSSTLQLTPQLLHFCVE